MKNKKLIIFFSVVFGLILFCTILSFTFFMLKDVQIEFHTETLIYSELESKNVIEQEVLKTSKKCIFFIQKQKLKNKIESENEYLKIINIETIFPNKLKIHCVEREEMYVLKNENTLYYTDYEFKVLKIKKISEEQSETADEYLSNLSNTDPVFLQNVLVANPTVKKGETIIIENQSELKNIYSAFFANNRSVAEIKGLIKKIAVNSAINYYTAHEEIFLEICFMNGFKTEIHSPISKLDEKIQIMLITLSEITPDNYPFFKLIIEENPTNGNFFVRLKEINS